LLRYTLAADETAQPGLCVLLREEPTHLPVFTPEQVTRYLNDEYRRYEGLLAAGAYRHLLPVTLRRRTVIEQFNVPRFVRAVQQLHPEPAADQLTATLQTYSD
jgi:hypothetical protein